MSEPATEEAPAYDAPNQQVVRPDGSGPWDEGEGGSTHPEPAPQQAEEEAEAQEDLDEMTKAELLEYAQEIGVSPANNNMTKEELREGVDAKLAEG